jgi:hypothetical protein
VKLDASEKSWEEGMTYRISYIDTSPDLPREQWPEGMTRTEVYPNEPAALARARELLEDVHCHRVLVSRDDGEALAGVCLQLKVGLACE